MKEDTNTSTSKQKIDKSIKKGISKSQFRQHKREEPKVSSRTKMRSPRTI